MSEERTFEVKPPMRKQWPGVLLGCGAVAFFHLLVAFGTAVFPSFWTGLFFLGITQLVYVPPLILMASIRKRNDIVKGVIIAASVTFLLNAACYGFILLSLRRS